ncbi:MAG: hypothetical protein WC979_03195 [Candidatus Pacearchaeota archaeon]|jgi:hypothetical protein|nr:hypothetical protein [Clostridia bacterium]
MKIIFTGYIDDNGNQIFTGDRLKSEYGYEVTVVKDGNDYVGKLICSKSHSCKDIPYSLNNGKGYKKSKPFEKDDEIRFINKLEYYSSTRLGSKGKIIKTANSVLGICHWIKFKSGENWLYDNQIELWKK